jgi:hypothetical protein
LRRNSPSSATAKPSDPKDADRRNFYKKWDEAEVHVEALINASNDWRVQKLSSPPKRRADHAVAFLAALIAKKESPGAKTGPWWGRNDRRPKAPVVRRLGLGHVRCYDVETGHCCPVSRQ